MVNGMVNEPPETVEPSAVVDTTISDRCVYLATKLSQPSRGQGRPSACQGVLL